MNQNFLNNADYTGVQSVEDIQRILQSAQTPGPGTVLRCLILYFSCVVVCVFVCVCVRVFWWG
jgi:hypothetical protein